MPAQSQQFAATKSESDGNHPASAYAYVPDPDQPSTWKLRIDDAAHVGAAAAALGPGYRGQKVEIPNADRAAVVAKVRAAWKRLNGDKDPDEMPEALKASEPGDPDWEQQDADNLDDLIAGINTAIQRESAELTADPDDADTVRQLLYVRDLLCAIRDGEQDEAESYDEPGTADLSVPTLAGAAKPTKRLNHYARKLKEKLRGYVPDSVFTQAHRSALGYAGGKSRSAFEPQRFAEDGVSAVSFMEPPDWIPYLPKPHKSTHPDYGVIDLTPERIQRFVQNFKAGVYQTELPIDAEHDLPGSGAMCFVTDMRVNADGSADAKVRWTDRGRIAIQGDRFSRVSPQWWDTWPDKVTGQTYQDVAIGGALTNRPFFKEGTLRPLAASEHWIGAVFGPPTRQEARQMADPGIEISDKGTHGAFTGQHQHDHTGGDGESHSEMHRHSDDGDHGHDCSDAMPFAGTEGARMTTDQKTFAEQLAQRDAEIAALRQASESSKQAAEQAKAAVEAMRKDAQTKRFTDEIMGRSDANGTRWLIQTREGEDYAAAQNRTIGTMRTLADTFGEDSTELADFIGSQRTLAEAVRHSEVFKAAGIPGGGEPSSAEARITALARQYTEKDHTLSLAAAQERVLSENPGLYEQYSHELEQRR